MAQLCIRVGANVPALSALRTQPGDVVCVQEDSHVFSKAERTNGQYRFISVGGVAASAFDALKAPRFAADGVTMTMVRNLRLDPVALAGGIWKSRTTATQAQIASITQTRP